MSAAIAGKALALGGLALMPGIAGMAVLGGASLVWYRWLFRHALKKSTEELEGMLQALETHLRSQQLFGAPPPTPPRRPPDDGGAGAFIAAMG